MQKLLAIGFLKHAVDGFRSYLSNRSFMINLESNCLQPASVSYGLPIGSILGLLLFLIYGCQHEDFNKTENQLNKEFSNICDWFMDKKRSIHFGEDKTKWILFYSKFKMKNIKKQNIEFGDIKIKLTF